MRKLHVTKKRVSKVKKKRVLGNGGGLAENGRYGLGYGIWRDKDGTEQYQKTIQI